MTGASQGIGEGIALRLSAEGYFLAINHFNRPDDAARVIEKIKSGGGDAIAISSDVGNSASVASMFSKIAELPLPLKLLINNAGVQTFAPLIDLKEEDFDRTLRTNLKGTFLCMQQAARLMKETGGDIINIGSGANRIPFPNLGDYCASKGGIEMLTKVGAVEFGRFGIRVNCIAPGAIENERTKLEDPTYAKTWGDITPLPRVGTIGDVAGTVAMLLTPETNFINGQTIFVDGGLWIRGQWPYAF